VALQRAADTPPACHENLHWMMLELTGDARWALVAQLPE
jgi:hypothetical protein